MPKIKQISKALSGAMLYFALGTLCVPVAQARSPKFLLKTQCVDTGVGNWSRTEDDVSIDKAVYTSLFYMGPGDGSASLTCKINPDNNYYYQRLNLGFGMRDNDRRSPPVDVNIYANGKRIDSRTISAGEKASVSLDVTNVRNVSLETVCSDRTRYCERVYFFKATLEPIPPPPAR